MDKERQEREKITRQKSRISEDSRLFSKIIPALLVGMGLLMVVLIIFAIGILTGLIPFQ